MTMSVIDVDSHFLEPMDWLEVTAPELAEQIAPPITFFDFMRSGTAATLPKLPEAIRPKDSADLMPNSFRYLMERLSALQPDHYDPSGGDPSYAGIARLKAMDEVGIDVQFLNFTYASAATLRAMQAGKPELFPAIQSAYNTFTADMVAGHTDRLVPVARMHIDDIDWCIAEITRMRALGSRAFWVIQNPTMSLTHPDYDRLWSAAEDLGMIAYIHVFFSRGEVVHPSWANNGRGLAAYKEGVAAGDPRADVRNFISALIFDGVFERHPKLQLLIAECGYSWFLPMMHEFDYRVRGIGADGGKEESFYKLPLLPSEYLARQVKISPLAGFVDTDWEFFTMAEMMDRLPDPSMFVFASDYPHLEGRHHAKKLFDDRLPADETLRANFYGNSMAKVLAS
jgi:predicted TIM-barrel fold metal-dependent hydrolase